MTTETESGTATWEVVVGVNLWRTFIVKAATPERAAELVAAGEPCGDDETVEHTREKEDGYDVLSVELVG